MAVTYKTGGGSSKPKKPKKPAPVNPTGKGGRTEGTAQGGPKTVVTTDTTKKTVIQREQKNPNVKFVAPKSSTATPTGGGPKNTSPVVKTAVKEQKREARQEARQDRRQERRENRREERREKTTTTSSRTGGGGTRKTGSLRTRDDGRSVTGTSGPRTKSNFYQNNPRDFRTDEGRPGGGFADVQNFRPRAYADNFVSYSGEGDRDLAISGGGGGAAGTNPLTSGTANADLDTLLKGAKRGRRQKRRRGTE